MTLCTSCNYPVPSWQHNGACKPVAEKVPPIVRVTLSKWDQEAIVKRLATPTPPAPALVDAAARIANKAADIGETIMRVTENPPALPKRRGRPKKDASLTAAQKQAAYRARKQQ